MLLYPNYSNQIQFLRSINFIASFIFQVMNYISTDTDRVSNVCQYLHLFWSLPFQIAISLYLLYEQVSVNQLF